MPYLPIPLLILALVALAWIRVAAARDRKHGAPRPLEFVCTIDRICVEGRDRWRWRIRDAGAAGLSDRVPYAWGTQAAQEDAMRAGHESFSRWLAGRPHPEGYRLLFEGDAVEAEWVG